eukprot:577847-Pyramimonas_sp.AAC.1
MDGLRWLGQRCKREGRSELFPKRNSQRFPHIQETRPQGPESAAHQGHLIHANFDGERGAK